MHGERAGSGDTAVAGQGGMRREKWWAGKAQPAAQPGAATRKVRRSNVEETGAGTARKTAWGPRR